MNEQKLIQNVIEQIKEAQLKLGAEKEVIRLYFPMASMNAILGPIIQMSRRCLRRSEQIQFLIQRCLAD